jgi:hypothetical protein
LFNRRVEAAQAQEIFELILVGRIILVTAIMSEKAKNKCNRKRLRLTYKIPPSIFDKLAQPSILQSTINPKII